MIIRIGVTERGNIKQFQAYTTDSESTYPTANECGPGSTMIIIDKSQHIIAGSKYFDGTDWNTV